MKLFLFYVFNNFWKNFKDMEKFNYLINFKMVFNVFSV